MSLYTQFQTSSDLEKQGIILQYGKNSRGDDIEIRIARAGGANTLFAKRLEAAMKPYRRQIQNDTIDLKVLTAVLRQVYAETVILGWQGVEGPDGEPIEHSVENCVRVLTDLPELFRDIQEQAQKMALFREEILEEDAKN